MPSSRLQWRALAALGALLLVVSLWPFTCAALPIELMTYKSNLWNNSDKVLSNLTNHKTYSSAMSQYSGESEKYSSNLRDDITNAPMTQTVFLRRKRKKANPNNRTTSYTIKNYFNAARQRTIIQKKELSSSTPQTLHLNDLYLAGTPSPLSITTYEPVVGSRKLSSNNSLQMRLSQATIQNEIIASVSTTTQITTSITLNQNPNDDKQLKLNRNNGAKLVAPHMFLNQTISPTLQTVFSHSPYGSRRLQMTSTESIFSRTERSIPAQSRAQGKKLTTGKRDSNLDRNERSTNFSHITGTSRKIQLLIKNRLLQLLPDGTVNGTQDDGSDYSE